MPRDPTPKQRAKLVAGWLRLAGRDPDSIPAIAIERVHNLFWRGDKHLDLRTLPAEQIYLLLAPLAGADGLSRIPDKLLAEFDFRVRVVTGWKCMGPKGEDDG